MNDAQLKADKAQYTSDVSDFDTHKKKDKKKYSSVKFAPEKTQKNNHVLNEINESHSSGVCKSNHFLYLNSSSSII